MTPLALRTFFAIVAAIFAVISLCASAAEQGNDTASALPPRTAVQLSLDGPVGPASADYFVRELQRAAQQGAALVVLRIDTPGGLDTSMREIVRAILASPVPVLGYVGPSGSRAASAGTFILYACHVAAMAPGTNLGAATPVAIGGFPSPGQSPEQSPERPPERPPEQQPDKADNGKDGVASAASDGGAKKGATKSAGESKALNDAIAYIRSLAELHGRNVDWAESAVRDAASLSAGDALAKGVIDLVATSVPDLLSQAHGRTVALGAGEVTLDTRNLNLQLVEPDLRSRLLGAISNPNLAVILMMIGIYGLIFEFMNPGALYPGTIGAICLLLGLFALSALPLNYAGLALLVLGIALMVAEVFTPSVGILGIGGVFAFVVGSTLLIDTDEPAFAISLPLMAGVGAASLAITLLIGRLALKSWHQPGVSGVSLLLHERATVIDWSGSSGHVLAEGERWRATGPQNLRPGQEVEICAVENLVLTVSAGAMPAEVH